MKKYALWLGTFDKDEFVWSTVEEFDSYKEAYKFYKNYVSQQLEMSDEELIDKHKSTRLDIELRNGNSRLNWTGIYARDFDPSADLNPIENEKADPVEE